VGFLLEQEQRKRAWERLKEISLSAEGGHTQITRQRGTRTKKKEKQGRNMQRDNREDRAGAGVAGFSAELHARKDCKIQSRHKL